MSARAVFSTEHFPDHLDDRARFSLWQETYAAEIGSIDFHRASDRPFTARIEAASVGSIVLAHMWGTITQSTRTARHLRRDNLDGYLLLVNHADVRLAGRMGGHSYEIEPGGAVLVSGAEPATVIGGNADHNWSNILIPFDLLNETIPDAENRMAIPISGANEALGLMKRYSRFIETGPALVAPELAAHAAASIVDLIALATGAKGDVAELAGLRGVRAARLEAVLAKIREGFANPMISAQGVAQDLGVSVRYVHDLLQETGMSFSERVLEARLRRVSAMLADRRYAGMRISEIAFACGFSDVSYFNRCFRRRFGCSPGQAR
ncbi:AraC family transcriptional regulator [Kaistia algarum]|uniref:helix-turn-helix transcriptional regulator n=1 Tax=Kaistia algarum TaxID=2083279 RepID=UPI000CE775C9|nr:AraC family transcriptional regulator [Kaistia algarum]MCX5516567.1 AraC family transcriptional regulator [Kaistia algarum]PPE77505.1 AraC family transcriptional regulator [Kaistia algarum]